MAQEQQKIKDIHGFVDVMNSLEVNKPLLESKPSVQGLIQRHWHANIGLKESYDLVDREVWDWNYSIFTGSNPEDDLFHIGKLYELFPCEIEKPIAEKLLEIYHWAFNYQEKLFIRTKAVHELIHWIHIFRLPLDVIDFLEWIQEKVVFKIPAFLKGRKKFKNYKYYYPYQQLYLVYKSNALK